MNKLLTAVLSSSAALTLAGTVAAQTRPAAPKATPPATQKPNTTPPANQPAANPNPSPATGPTEVGGKTLEQWVKEIDHPDPSVREHAIRMVLMFGPNARKAIPALVKQVRSLNDLSPQANAIIALSVLGPAAPEFAKDVVDALTVAVDNPQGIIRYQAATALGNMGPVARTAVPKLANHVNDRASWEIRKAACFALGSVGRDEQGMPDMRALAALVDAAKDYSKEVRMEALQGLINLGPPASGNVSQMRNLLEGRLKYDQDKSVTIWVRVAIMRLDEKAINDANLSIIAKQMKGTDVDIRIQAARALGYIGYPARSKLPELIEALKDEEPLMVQQVCWSIVRMGADAEKALPSLETLLSHKDGNVKASAKAAIEDIKKSVEQAKKNPPKK
jgi:HEAT repeat protein